MSTRAAKPPARKSSTGAQGEGATEGAAVVQQVLAERRELMIANERLRLELEEIRARPGKPDPRLRLLESENQALREQLTRTQFELDELQAAVARAVAQIKRASL